MKFHMPVKVYCERDCVKTYSDEWTSLGHKALIVTGRSSAKNGALADVTDSLNAHQISYCIFDHTEENPSIEMVMQVRDMGIRENVDFVIGIGGEYMSGKQELSCGEQYGNGAYTDQAGNR